jgi:hypothetical protein
MINFQQVGNVLTINAAKFLGVTILNEQVQVDPSQVIEWLKLLPQIAIAIHSVLSIFGIKIPIPKRKKKIEPSNISTDEKK